MTTATTLMTCVPVAVGVEVAALGDPGAEEFAGVGVLEVWHAVPATATTRHAHMVARRGDRRLRATSRIRCMR